MVLLFAGLFAVSTNPYQFTPTVHFREAGDFEQLCKQCKLFAGEDEQAQECLNNLGWHKGGLKIGSYYLRYRNWLVSLTTTPLNDGKPFTYKVN